MTADFEYRSRPGNLALSLAALAGLTLLAAVIWTIAPVYALVLMVPAILISFYQIIVSPIYGLKVSPEAWAVFSEQPDQTIPLSEIGHVQFSDKPGQPRCTLVLNDGTAIALPDQALPDDMMELIRQTSERGMKIRQV